MLKFLKSETDKEASILSIIAEQESSRLINLIGYVIFGLTLLDFVMTLIPPQFFDSIWEIQTIGQLVERSWAVLLGLILIFYRRSNDFISTEELFFISLISRFALFLGIVYFLTIPLLLSNTIRLSHQNSFLVNQQLTVQSEQVQDLTAQLNQKSKIELEQLITNYSQNDKNLKFDSTEDFKAKVLTNIKTQEQANKQQFQQTLKEKQTNLYKNAFKWSLGAILSGFSLILIWNSTQWVRILQSEQN